MINFDKECLEKIEKIKYYNIYDYRTFKLVKDGLNCKLKNVNHFDEKTNINNHMLSENQIIIKNKIKEEEINTDISTQYEYLKSLIYEYNKYQRSSKTKNSNECKIVQLKLTYLLIELKSVLGLELNDIALQDVMNYCIMIASDIKRDDYKSLSIIRHIDNKEPRLKYVLKKTLQ